MRRLSRAVGLTLIVALASSSVFAEDMKPAPRAANVEQVPDLAGATVSVPWSALRTLFGGKGGGAEVPVDFVWVDAKYSMEANETAASMKATATIRVLSSDWAAVPLGPAASSLISATVDEKPCAIFLREDRLFALISGKGEHRLEVLLEGETRHENNEMQVFVPLIPAPVVLVEASLPRGPLDVVIPGAVGLKTSEKGKRTTVACTLRGDQTAVVFWKSRPKRAVEAVVTARVDTLVTVESNRLLCRAHVNYEVLRSGVSKFLFLLPEGAELRTVKGANVSASRTHKDPERTLVEVEVAKPVEGAYELVLEYASRVTAKQKEVAVPLLIPTKVASWAGHVAVEMAANADIHSKPEELERIDITELPADLRNSANRAVVLAYQFKTDVGNAAAKLTLAIDWHQDARVLVAMCDVCEVSTVLTRDGRRITKMMFITRNNAKPSLALDMPQDAQVWSALVDDRPVSPARNAKGQLLVPLVKSQPVDEDGEESYQYRREERRKQGIGEAHVLREQVKRLAEKDDRPRDLKPYDIEIVYVQNGKLADERGELDLQLPQCDIPIGRMAWAVFLPDALRVVDVSGNLEEVPNFSLPFVHFGEAADTSRAASRTSRASQGI